MSDVSNIGLVHTTPLPKDAIHIAIAQVTAGDDNLQNGELLNWKDGVEGTAYRDFNAIGIVDPFIKTPIKKGDKFYMFLMPNSVTSLTHLWEHPAFNRSDERIAEALKWLDSNCGDYYDYGDDDPVGRVKEYSNAENFISMFSEGKFTWYGASGDDFSELYNSNADGFRKKFWDNLEIVTGRSATKEQRDQEYFSCSC